jgi:hypothetical protein
MAMTSALPSASAASAASGVNRPIAITGTRSSRRASAACSSNAPAWCGVCPSVMPVATMGSP